MKQNRRSFLKKSAAAASLLGFPTIIPNTVLAAPGRTLPNDRVNLGFIGVGQMGSGHLRSFLGYDDVEVVAVCDVRREFRERAKERIEASRGKVEVGYYNDFRELLARDDVDAMVQALPDHWHVLSGIEAAKQGKAMYYEKTLSYTVEEAQVLREVIHRYNAIFQLGTQQRSSERFRHAVELVRNEYIGPLQKITIGSASFTAVPDQPTEPVPDGLDYEMWLGPAPYAPYNTLRCSRDWTLIRDYSLGCIGSAWGIHHVDIAQWAMDADNSGPISVEGTGTIPEGLFNTFQKFDVQHTYANGVILRHVDHISAQDEIPQFAIEGANSMGVLFEGEDGWVYVARNYIDASPKRLLRQVIGPNEIKLPVSNDHRRNFLDAVKKGTNPITSIDAGVKAEIVCQQADIAMRMGKKLYWDNDKEQFIDNAEANTWLSRPMRGPWSLPKV